MKYQECEVEYVDVNSRYEVKATSFYVQKRNKEYDRNKMKKKLEKEEK